MVAKNDGHDHEFDWRCPGCVFREAMYAALKSSHDSGAEAWHYTVGDLRRAMHAALLALDHIEARPYTDDGPLAPFEDAADSIAKVGEELEQLWHDLMPDDEPGANDGSVGL